ncbi:MAG: late secretory pathway protein avl9 [Icmadophila ericetorum]|nr:late secretory pathway protein avl9 [Icmadophila ericetorum]
MGLPLQIFGKGSLFGPYTPLQQLDTLADYGTKSYIVGSTNALLLQQRDRYSDILINLDDSTISITSSSLRNALNLSAADRRWIDFLTATVSDSWDESNPSRPKTMGYMGSEEFIRLQFEEYLLALLSSVKYHMHLHPHSAHRSPTEPDIDPVLDFNIDWVDAWQQTASFSLFNRFTDSNIFDIVEPKHPTAGGLSIDDINRRIAQQIQELHLDERLATSREALNKHLVTGQKKVSTAFNNLWADIEAMREAQRKRAEESRAAMTASTGALPSPSPASPPSSKIGRGGFFDGGKNSSSTDLSSPRPRFDTTALRARAPDLSQAQASVQAVGQKAGAYLSSWGSWASERRKGWGAQKPGSGTSVSTFMGEGKGPGPGTSEIGERGSGMNPGVETDRGTRIDLKGREKEEDKDERSGGSAAGGRPISPRKTKSFAKSAREERGGDGIGRLDA